MAQTSEFDTASAALVMGPNIVLFSGGKADSKGSHAIQLLSAPLPQQGVSPSFSVPTVVDQSGSGAISNAVIESVAASVPPVAFAVDPETFVVVYQATDDMSQYSTVSQTFTWDDTTGFTRTQARTTLWQAQESPKATLGAATVPGTTWALVATVAPSDGNEIYVMCMDTAGAQVGTIASVPGPTDTAWHGDVAMTVVRNNVDGTAAEPYLLLAACAAGQTVYGGYARVGLDSYTGAPVINGGSWTITPMSVDSDFAESTPATVSFQRGPDGIAYLMFLDKEWRTLHYGNVAYASRQPMQWNGVLPSKYNDLHHIPPVVYTSDPFPDDPAPVTTARVFRTFIFDETHVETVQVGQARQTVGQTDPLDDPPGILVGWIEGGPPVPNENIQGLNPDVVSSLASMQYGVSSSSDTDTTYEVSLGLMIKTNVEAGVPWLATVDVDMDFSTGYVGKWSQASVTTVQTGFKIDSAFDPHPAPLAVKKGGVAYVYTVTSYTTFQYEFLDAAGNLLPTADVFVQLVPNEPLINSFPFAIDPARTDGPVPGNLQSYVMDPQTLQELESSAAIPCTLTTKVGTKSSTDSFPLTTWTSADGDSYQDVGYLDKGSTTQGMYVDTSVMIGQTVVGTTIQAGMQSKFALNVGWGSEQSSHYTSETDKAFTGPLEPPPGQYSRYAFLTLMLAPAPVNLSHLLEVLEFEDTGGLNADLKAHILSTGSPWMITYAVTSSHVVEPGEQEQVQPHTRARH